MSDVKGIVLPKMNILPSFTLMSLQTYMSFFVMLNIKEDILKNTGNQRVDGPH